MGEAKRRKDLDPEWGKAKPPYTLGPVERDKDNKMFVRCLIEQGDGRIEWLIYPSLGKGGEIWCSGAMGVTGLSMRQAKAITDHHQPAVYRECGHRFKAQIAEVDLLLVEAAP